MSNLPDGLSLEVLDNATAGYEPDIFVVPDDMVVTRTSNATPNTDCDYFAMYKAYQCDGDLVGQGSTPEFAVIDLLAQHDGLDDDLKAKYLTKGDL